MSERGRERSNEKRDRMRLMKEEKRRNEKGNGGISTRMEEGVNGERIRVIKGREPGTNVGRKEDE